MQQKVIIVGQGISGTCLSWFLHQAAIDFVVIDKEVPNSPSQVAAGIINPVTGRRVVQVWLDDILLPFAEKTYDEIGRFLGITAISKTQITEFFPNPFMKESFVKKLHQHAPYISINHDEDYLKAYFHYEFGSGSIVPAYLVHLQQLLPCWRNYLLKENKLINELLDPSKLQLGSNKVWYNGIEADRIIFCDGVQGAQNPWFSLLPFALNKGEALTIYAPQLPFDVIYKKSMMLAPMLQPGYFWIGSSYVWDYSDDTPTNAFKDGVMAQLKNWLKVPFEIISHKAALRPATVERRPFVGYHPLHNNTVGILNGMGTKGCSLAPYFAHQLKENIVNGTSILPEADVNRFARLLSR